MTTEMMTLRHNSIPKLHRGSVISQQEKVYVNGHQCGQITRILRLESRRLILGQYKCVIAFVLCYQKSKTKHMETCSPFVALNNARYVNQKLLFHTISYDTRFALLFSNTWFCKPIDSWCVKQFWTITV